LSRARVVRGGVLDWRDGGSEAFRRRERGERREDKLRRDDVCLLHQEANHFDSTTCDDLEVIGT